MRSETLEFAIGLISPKLAAKRARDYMALERVEKLRNYEGASISRRTSNWRATNDDPNEATRYGLALLRARSRDLVRNNPYGERGVRVITSNSIGTGIIPQAKSKRSKRKVERVEEYWYNWGGSVSCDHDGVLDFYGIQNLVMREVAESGEVFVRRHIRRSTDGLPLPIQLQVLEADYLDHFKNETLGNGNKVIRGIEFDTRGRRVAYWMYEEHPGSQFSYKFTSNRIPAQDILHIYRVDRAGQVIGVPWSAPILLRMRDLDEYEDAQLIRQKIAACFTAFIRNPDGNSADEDEKLVADLERLEPGLIRKLGIGEEVTFGDPPKAEGYSEHTKSVLRSMAIGWGITYEALTGDLSQVNFSSGRMGWLEMQRNIDQWRRMMIIPMLCRPVWQWFLESLDFVGVDASGVSEIWTPPRREMIDPVKETNAILTQVRGGLKSLPEAHREMGRDTSDVFQEIKETYEKSDELGLVLESDARTKVNPESFKDSNDEDETSVVEK